MFEHREREGTADKLVAGSRSERGEGVVDVADAAIAVATDDHIALCCEKTPGALFGFAELPIAIGKIFGPFAQLFGLLFEPAIDAEQERRGAAGRAEQGGGADREQMRIIIRCRIAHHGEEPERGRIRHRQQRDCAHDER